MMTIQTVGQLKILQKRLFIMCDKYSHITNDENDKNESTNGIKVHDGIYTEFKSCIDQHKTIIDFIDKLESLFTCILLCQMLVSSLLMCLGGFQLLMASNILFRTNFQ